MTRIKPAYAWATLNLQVAGVTSSPNTNSTMATPPRRRARRRGRGLGWLVFVILLGAAGYGGWLYYQSRQNTQGEISYVAVRRADIEDLVSATGTLQPRDYVDVGAQVSGQLMRIHVEVGDAVKQGDLLAEIDATVLQSRVEASGANLRSLRAQQKDREASLKLAQLQHTRQQQLKRDNATSTEAWQSAQATLQSAQAQLEAIKAQIDQAESNLKADSANLRYTRIFAPMDGTVVSVSARQGQTLNANQTTPTVLQIADLTTMTVQAQVSEADVPRLRAGMPAYFTTLGGEGARWHGELVKIEPTPTVTNNVVLYNALFDVANDDGRLMKQMTAQVFFVVADAQDVLAVPLSALRFAPAGRGAGAAEAAAAAGEPGRMATVRVAGPDGQPVERQVRVGVSNRLQAEVLDGLNENDRIALAGAAAGNGGGGGSARGPGPGGPLRR